MKTIVECTGLRDANGKTPRHEFASRREADEWAEWGHFCFAWHRFFTVKDDGTPVNDPSATRASEGVTRK